MRALFVVLALAATGAGPELPSADLAGLTARIEQDRGHPLLISFWATWCVPCVQEIPALNGLQEALGPAGARFLAVSLDRLVYPDPDEARRRVADVVASESFRLPVLLYAGDPEALSRTYQVPAGLPHALLLSPDGAVLERVEGQLREGEVGRLTARIRAALEGD
ncbi:MAG: TlpA disulfide reductase family protein [Acidobacteriota bacterium]|jgi:thiol-disulfide isomerase/thioredoxin